LYFTPFFARQYFCFFSTIFYTKFLNFKKSKIGEKRKKWSKTEAGGITLLYDIEHVFGTANKSFVEINS